ncbi:hypothetical protein RP726_15920 [Candidatus Methylospira mobilis]|uniref:hypothetical protein n=1 Tax=Candidatus Methylospira mobilis TaxID=1808979 RepID=UPI00129304A1|nr:hypothetical protein [Candidatus Methylospira mobilis]WNV03903.1 hypothetical protein RP726_15920 [Candidatus Methylospira mobilis]
MTEKKAEAPTETHEVDSALSNIFTKVKENPKSLLGSKTLYGVVGAVLVAIFLL